MIAATPRERAAAPPERWTDIFRYDPLVHLGLLGAIAAGMFQGYIKDRVGGFVPYLLADGLFIMAVVAWFGALAVRHTRFRGPSRAIGIILATAVVPAFYLLAPGTPLVVKAAGLRAWIEFPVAALVALSVVRNAEQVRVYIRFILLLCIITAIYGIIQYRSGPSVVQQAGVLSMLRHGGTTAYYIESTGQTEFRAYSTFTFPAPFAGMMVFAMLLAAGSVVASKAHLIRRLFTAALVLLFFMGMTVSGTRAALLTLLGGLAIIAWYRGITFRQFLVLPVVLIGLQIGSVLTAGRILERYKSVDESILWTYAWAPISIAARAIAANPFGEGLGRSGVGVPYFIMGAFPGGFFTGSDGDIGRAAVELGVTGLALLLLIIVGLLPTVGSAIRGLADSPAEDVSLGAGALVMSTGALLLIGSPLSTIPHGLIWWFLLGSVIKLHVLRYDQDRQAAAG
ncbi:MAG TPA: hypothetical protein VGI83_01420 [Gemmatimonadales bacterium]|jgi:hypothetical protein